MRTTWKHPLCPFCKAVLEMRHFYGINRKDDTFSIECPQCRASGPEKETRKRALAKWKSKFRADGEIRGISK